MNLNTATQVNVCVCVPLCERESTFFNINFQVTLAFRGQYCGYIEYIDIYLMYLHLSCLFLPLFPYTRKTFNGPDIYLYLNIYDYLGYYAEILILRNRMTLLYLAVQSYLQ